MNNILKIFKCIYIHPLLWFIILLSILTAHFIELSLFLLIILIHELGHAIAASFFSWRIKRISLLPFGGVAEVDEHGNRPLKEEAIVTIAGPIQHIWMIGTAFLLNKLAFFPTHLYETFIYFNVMILLFNFLPIWPLDGGKLFYLWRSSIDSFPIAHRKTLKISLFCLVLFFIFQLIIQPINVSGWVVTAFLAFSIYFEWKQRHFVFLRFLLERYYGDKIGFISLKRIHVSENESISAVLEQFQRGCKHLIVIEKKDNETEQLDENEVLHAYFSKKMLSSKIGELIYPY